MGLPKLATPRKSSTPVAIRVNARPPRSSSPGVLGGKRASRASSHAPARAEKLHRGCSSRSTLQPPSSSSASARDPASSPTSRLSSTSPIPAMKAANSAAAASAAQRVKQPVSSSSPSPYSSRSTSRKAVSTPPSSPSGTQVSSATSCSSRCSAERLPGASSSVTPSASRSSSIAAFGRSAKPAAMSRGSQSIPRMADEPRGTNKSFRSNGDLDVVASCRKPFFLRFPTRASSSGRGADSRGLALVRVLPTLLKTREIVVP